MISFKERSFFLSAATGTLTFVSLIILPYDIPAQTLHYQTLEEIANQIVTLEDHPQIDVGGQPDHMAVYEVTHTGLDYGTNPHKI